MKTHQEILDSLIMINQNLDKTIRFLKAENQKFEKPERLFRIRLNRSLDVDNLYWGAEYTLSTGYWGSFENSLYYSLDKAKQIMIDLPNSHLMHIIYERVQD